MKHQDVVKLYVRNGILPAIAQQPGTRFRRDILRNHFAQTYHKHAISPEKRKRLENPTQMEVSRFLEYCKLFYFIMYPYIFILLRIPTL